MWLLVQFFMTMEVQFVSANSGLHNMGTQLPNESLNLILGILSPLCRIRTENNLGHQICQNLRDGDWLIDYITSRLSHYKPLNQV